MCASAVGTGSRIGSALRQGVQHGATELRPQMTRLVERKGAQARGDMMPVEGT
jgi:hypothetical protein